MASQYGAMATGTPLLTALGIGRRADTGAWLLREVSLELHAGERLALTGPSGAGKSLVLRALALLDPLDAGEILWRGRTVEGKEIPDFRRHVVYLSQRPALVEGTVEDNLRLPYTLAVHRDRSFDRPRAVRLLEQLRRDEVFLSAESRHLSGGESQLTALVRAIQLDPGVILLDEPTASLDDTTSAAVESLINQWIEDAADTRAVIWTSHDAPQTTRVADRLLELADGGRVGQPASR